MCGQPLGIEDGRIPNSSMWSTMPTNPGYEGHRARLNSDTSWNSMSKDPEAHLRVDLGKVYKIDEIQTQGSPGNLYSTTIKKPASCK